jgi:hypothetical protein
LNSVKIAFSRRSTTAASERAHLADGGAQAAQAYALNRSDAMWKKGDPDRRKGADAAAVRERRRHQRWRANVDDRWCRHVRDEYHDAHATTIRASMISGDRKLPS